MSWVDCTCNQYHFVSAYFAGDLESFCRKVCGGWRGISIDNDNDRKVTYMFFIEINYYALRTVDQTLEVAVLSLTSVLTETPHSTHYNAKARKHS